MTFTADEGCGKVVVKEYGKRIFQCPLESRGTAPVGSLGLGDEVPQKLLYPVVYSVLIGVL